MIDDLIISGLMNNEEFTRKAVPHIQPDYFSDPIKRVLYKLASAYFSKFNRLPTADILKLGVGTQRDISVSDHATVFAMIDGYGMKDPENSSWLLEQTEEFCKGRAIYNAIMDSIAIIDGSDKDRTVEALPTLLQQALAVSFNTAVGHSYIDDASTRFDAYTRVDARLPFNIRILNTITGGGLVKKSLSVWLAQSGGGKSLVMTHMAAGFLADSRNVLYITLEMSEEKISERIDANLMDVQIDQLDKMGKDRFLSKIDSIREKTKGRLYVKEYPQGRAHTGHFRALLSELKTKQNFVPDVILVDYLGICASSTIKLGGSVNTYVYAKAVAEELRALAMEVDLPIITAAQVNRNGYNNSDMDLTDISDSLGIVMTADLILGIIRSEELDAQNQIMMVQMKNRYSDPSSNKRFLVGIDRAKMKLLDLDYEDSVAGLMKEPNYAPQAATPGFALANRGGKKDLSGLL